MSEIQTAESRLPRKGFNWRLLGVLVAMIFVGYVAIIPYSLTLQSQALKTTRLPLPLWILIPIQVLEGGVLYALLAGVGLFLAGRIGLGAPILDGWLRAKNVKKAARRILLPSIVLGVLGSLLILVIEITIFSPLLGADLKRIVIPLPANLTPPAWQGLLAAFYGGFDEEILLRLFALSLLAWLGARMGRQPSGRPQTFVLWIANILAAILFGLGHLPATAAAGLPIDALVVTRAVVLNGLLGIGFGWLYFTYGLESAMLAHFSADLILHVVAPLLAVL
ncbi:MAG: CPBP family glutamic-type intramembrane protease [Anaerolineales bacterium]